MIETLGLTTILLIVGLIIYFGLLRPVETLAAAADSRVSAYASKWKLEDIDTVSSLEIDAAKVESAKSKAAMLASVKF